MLEDGLLDVHGGQVLYYGSWLVWHRRARLSGHPNGVRKRIVAGQGGVETQEARQDCALAEQAKELALGRHTKLLDRIVAGRSDAAIRFSEIVQLLRYLGFDERIRGDHHIFSKNGIEEILNLQPRGAVAKPYQVRQVRNVILRYGLGADDNE